MEAPLRIPDQSDGELAAAAARGDGDAFGRLVERHTLQARRVARAILRNNEDAEDAVQDGVLAAWRALGRYDPARPFRPWLMRIVVNAALDARRLAESSDLARERRGREQGIGAERAGGVNRPRGSRRPPRRAPA